MNTVRTRWVTAAVGALAMTLLNACTVTGVGVEGTVGADYDAGYYEPYGYEYGGWGDGYRVGPGRGGDRRGDDWHGGDRGGGDRRGGDQRGGDQRGGDQRGAHAPAYRPAPASRPTPSIPRGSRGGSRGH
jgi:hypothetical protein